MAVFDPTEACDKNPRGVGNNPPSGDAITFETKMEVGAKSGERVRLNLGSIFVSGV